jgi:hypothetical protein
MRKQYWIKQNDTGRGSCTALVEQTEGASNKKFWLKARFWSKANTNIHNG